MVQSFLWMQLSKENDNPGLNRQSIARIVAQSFNRRASIDEHIPVEELYTWSAHGLNPVLYQVQKPGQINTIYLGWRMKTWSCQ